MMPLLADSFCLFGREFHIRNSNTIGVQDPILHSLALTEFYLGQFGCMCRVGSFDLDRTLADFSFMPVFAKHIFQESSYIARHGGPPVSNCVLAIDHPQV